MSLKYRAQMFLAWLVCIAVIMIAGKWAWERSISPYVVVGLAVTLVFLLVNAVTMYLVQRDRKMRSNIRALNDRLLVLENERDISLYLRVQASVLVTQLKRLDISANLPVQTQVEFRLQKKALLAKLQPFSFGNIADEEYLAQAILTATDFIDEVTKISRRADTGLADVA